jgi:hypothetical protein
VGGWRADDAADDSRRCDHRHIPVDPVRRTPTYRDREQPGVGIARDHLCRHGRHGRRRLQVQELLQPLRARGERALFLQLYLQVGQLPLERFVFRPRTAQPDVAAPEMADPVQRRRRRSLHPRERAKRHRLKDRHARSRGYLQRNQDQMPHGNRDQEHAGAAADV